MNKIYLEGKDQAAKPEKLTTKWKVEFNSFKNKYDEAIKAGKFEKAMAIAEKGEAHFAKTLDELMESKPEIDKKLKIAKKLNEGILGLSTAGLAAYGVAKAGKAGVNIKAGRDHNKIEDERMTAKRIRNAGPHRSIKDINKEANAAHYMVGSKAEKRNGQINATTRIMMISLCGIMIPASIARDILLHAPNKLRSYIKRFHAMKAAAEKKLNAALAKSQASE